MESYPGADLVGGGRGGFGRLFSSGIRPPADRPPINTNFEGGARAEKTRIFLPTDRQ